MPAKLQIRHADRGDNHPADIARYEARQKRYQSTQAERDFVHNLREVACGQVGLDYVPVIIPNSVSAPNEDTKPPLEVAQADVRDMNKMPHEVGYVNRRNRPVSWEICVPVPSEYDEAA